MPFSEGRRTRARRCRKSSLRFLGIDFGWVNGASGLASLALEDGTLRLCDSRRLTEPEAIFEWVDAQTGDGPAMIAIDAPTIIANETGMRVPDRLAHVHFGKYDAGSYPANLGRPFAVRTLALSGGLLARGFAHAPAIEPRRPGRYQIEVHPHAASVRLFSLDRIVKYKKGTVAERARGLRRYRRLLVRHLRRAEPPLDPEGIPSIPRADAGFKSIEDRIDAVMAAYIGAHWWWWGAARNQVLGSEAEGFLVIPAPAAAV